MTLKTTLEYLKESCIPPSGIGVSGPEVDAFWSATFDDNPVLKQICDRVESPNRFRNCKNRLLSKVEELFWKHLLGSRG